MIPPAWAAAVFSGLACRVRRHVVSVSVDADGTLSFRTRLRTVVVPAGSLQAIRPARADAWGLADWRVVTPGPLLTLPRTVHRHPELVAAARRWNPHAEFAHK